MPGLDDVELVEEVEEGFLCDAVVEEDVGVGAHEGQVDEESVGEVAYPGDGY